MTQPDAQREPISQPFEFLIVDEFLKTLVDARALKTAFELGLVDRILEHRRGSIEALGRAVDVDQRGMRFLLDLLRANGVVEERSGDVRFSRRFVTALRYRDLLETKLDFAGFTINDFADLFTALVKNPAGVHRASALVPVVRLPPLPRHTVRELCVDASLDAHNHDIDPLRGACLLRSI